MGSDFGYFRSTFFELAFRHLVQKWGLFSIRGCGDRKDPREKMLRLMHGPLIQTKITHQRHGITHTSTPEHTSSEHKGTHEHTKAW